MSEILKRVQTLVKRGEFRVSLHGSRELDADAISLSDVLAEIGNASLVEEYPEGRKEPSVLVLQYDADRKPVHVMWGIPKATDTPAILVTAYRPAPERWSVDFLKRSK